MHFDRRDLKPYAEPVTPGSLVVGEVYFSVQYHDQGMLVPEVEALVFLGDNLDPGPDAVGHYFQDAGSFIAGARYDAGASEEDGEGNEAHIYLQPPGQVKHIFSFESALDELLKCTLRRAKAGAKITRIEPGRPTRA